VYCYSFFLLSFCTIICKLIVLPLTFFFLKIYLNILLMQSYYKIYVHLEFVVLDGCMLIATFKWFFN
jgi:hypothetical protein